MDKANERYRVPSDGHVTLCDIKGCVEVYHGSGSSEASQSASSGGSGGESGEVPWVENAMVVDISSGLRPLEESDYLYVLQPQGAGGGTGQEVKVPLADGGVQSLNVLEEALSLEEFRANPNLFVTQGSVHIVATGGRLSGKDLEPISSALVEISEPVDVAVSFGQLA